MIFKNEKDVRGWIGDTFPDVFWIEPARGSTVGFPDCMIASRENRGRPIFLELKCGADVAIGRPPIIRAMQSIQLRRLDALGFQAGVLWAIRDTNQLLIFPAARLFRGSNQDHISSRVIEAGGWRSLHLELLARNVILESARRTPKMSLEGRSKRH